MIKLIATDLDGTLLDSNGCVDDEIFDIIRTLEKMGIMFAAASGRQLMSLKRRFKPVENDILYIAENGGYSVYKGEELCVGALKKDIVNDILDSAEEVKGGAVFLCGKTYAYSDSEELIELMRKPIFGYEIKYAPNLKKVDDDIFKVGLFDTMDPREGSLKIMKPRFGDKVHLTLSGYNSLDFLSPEVNKGYAMKKIRNRFNIKKDEIVAFGDNFNDLEMFDEVGYSCAMSNADEAVRKRAKYVIGSNDDNSVVKTLKRIIKEIQV